MRRAPASDPTARSLDAMANELEAAGIFVHALAMVPSNTRHHDAVLELAFRRIGIGTGGAFHAISTGDTAMAVVEAIAAKSIIHLDFDRKLHEFLPKGGDDPDIDALAQAARRHRHRRPRRHDAPPPAPAAVMTTIRAATGAWRARHRRQHG